MFDRAACGSLRLTPVPTVDCDALLALQAVLRTARGSATDDERDARHSSVVDTGGADAAVCEPHATQPSLFQAPLAHPSFQRFPPDTQAKTIVLLARLLRHEAELCPRTSLTTSALSRDTISVQAAGAGS